MEQRTRDLEWVSTVRMARMQAVSLVQSGQDSFHDLLTQFRADSYLGRAYVVALTDVHGCLGKVAGRRLMATIGIEPLARVADLTDDQITALSECCSK